MKKIMAISFVVFLCFATIFSGCVEEEEEDETDIEDGVEAVEGTLLLQITDKPVDLDIIYANVTISTVQVHKSSGDDEEDSDEDGFVVDSDGEYEGSIGELIQFEGDANNGIEPYSWSWDFGDGDISYEQNPQHAYMAEGEYEVNLTVTDDTGAIAWDTTIATIEDKDENNDGFIADADGPYNGYIDELIYFEGDASGGIEPYNWSWDFGDGNTSYEQNPQHAYMAEDEYEVNLTVTDDENKIDWDTTIVTIEADEENGDDPSQAGWYTIVNESQTFDLMVLQNVTDVLGEKNLSEGKYTQIRLTVEKAIITIINDSEEMEVHDLKIPSNKVKLIKPFWIFEGETTVLTLDFDVYESVHKTGSDKYMMKPTIKVIQE